MSKKPKKGTMWLLSRLKEGEIMTKQVREELFDYISQLEVSLDRCYHFMRQTTHGLFELLLDPLPAREAIKNLDARLPPEYAAKQDALKTWELSGDQGVYREICIHRDLDSYLADLAWHNGISTGDLIRRACEHAANFPGAVGLTSLQPQESEQEG